MLDKIPKSLQPKAKAALHEMMNAPTKAECEKLVAAFVAEHESKYPKAAKAQYFDGRSHQVLPLRQAVTVGGRASPIRVEGSTVTRKHARITTALPCTVGS